MKAAVQPAALVICALALAGCSVVRGPSSTASWYGPTLTPISDTSRDLVQLPLPKGKIVASVYGFRDQTGQYKPAPDSSFSTAVTQGAGSLLVKAIADSGWFIPVEREGLQNLLTERRIVRALETRPGQKPPADTLSGLLPASVLLEGGVIAYEQDVRTGGIGVRYFGIGASDQYRSDQVTVNLRAVDIRTGRILASVSTTKTVFSFKLAGDVFRFVSFKRLLEAEAGYTTNEPAQLALRDAIEAAVIHLIVQGIRENHWSLRNAEDMDSAVVRAYLDMQRGFVTRFEVEKMLESSPRQTTPE